MPSDVDGHAHTVSIPVRTFGGVEVRFDSNVQCTFRAGLSLHFGPLKPTVDAAVLLMSDAVDEDTLDTADADADATDAADAAGAAVAAYTTITASGVDGVGNGGGLGPAAGGEAAWRLSDLPRLRAMCGCEDVRLVSPRAMSQNAVAE